MNVQTNHGQANMAYLNACLQAGYPSNPDYNGAGQGGHRLAQVNHRRGTRSQASREYLRRVAPRGRVTVRTHSYVYRILLERGAAVGVQYRRKGTVRDATAREEVVISAGAAGGGGCSPRRSSSLGSDLAQRCRMPGCSGTGPAGGGPQPARPPPT